jgi:hypothetical protein
VFGLLSQFFAGFADLLREDPLFFGARSEVVWVVVRADHSGIAHRFILASPAGADYHPITRFGPVFDLDE